MREKKLKIVVYFGKKRENCQPFEGFGHKQSVYHSLFQKGIDCGLEMFVSSGREYYFGGLTFGNLLKYEHGAFVSHAGTIEADAVLDRSSGSFFPTKEVSSKVLNGIDFKWLCWDKNLTYELLGEFMPKSIKVLSTKEARKALRLFDKEQLAVLKPASDFAGKGIYIDYPKQLFDVEIAKDYVLQEFVDTSSGIEGVVKGRHDLRLIVVGGEIVLAHVRCPKDGGYLANVAQGGSIKEIALEKIPTFILSWAKKIQEIVDTKFNKPLYSIDLGVMGKKVFLFELNDQIGFPSEEMASSKLFIDKTISALERLAQEEK